MKIVDVAWPDGSQAKGLIEDGETKQLPVIVDFLSPRLKHRLKNGADSESIVKAMGVKKSERSGKLIYDFTAGLGTESYLLAASGFSVIAFERDPLVYQILVDGLRRLKLEFPDIKLEFRQGDAAILVESGLADGSLAVAYAVTLDPMFENDAIHGKSQPKKEMATLRRHLRASSEQEMKKLFQVARLAAEARVIVKRPAGAEELFREDETGRSVRPAHRLEGKSARFDIYSCR